MFQESFKSSEVSYPVQLLVLHEIRKLQVENIPAIRKLGYDPHYIISGLPGHKSAPSEILIKNQTVSNDERPEDGTATNLKPELGKTLISLGLVC